MMFIKGIALLLQTFHICKRNKTLEKYRNGYFYYNVILMINLIGRNTVKNYFRQKNKLKHCIGNSCILFFTFGFVKSLLGFSFSYFSDREQVRQGC